GEFGPPIFGAGCHCAFSFCVEKPFTPAWARMLGKDAGNPKQSGNIYSALALPKSFRKYSFPYNTSRKIPSALGRFTSPSSTEEPAGNQRPSAAYFCTRA